MATQLKFLFILIIVLCGAHIARAGLFSDSWRYKMTITVETPDGLKSGYSVREVRRYHGIKLNSQMTPDITYKGEAVVVDLADRGVLFSPLRGNRQGPDYVSDVFLANFQDKDKHDSLVLDIKDYPSLVAFTDIADPKTIVNVLKIESDNKLRPKYWVAKNRTEELFGKGVRIKEVKIEPTDESVTSGVVKYLPWLADYQNMTLDGMKIHTIKSAYPLANSFTGESFSTEIK